MTGVSLPAAMSSAMAAKSGEFGLAIKVTNFWLRKGDREQDGDRLTKSPNIQRPVGPPTPMIYPLPIHDTTAFPQRVVPNAIEEQVITSPEPREVLARVIYDLIGANGPHHLHVPSAAHPGHLCAEGLGDWHRERAHAARRAINQDLYSRPNVSLVAKTLQRREASDGHSRRLLKRHVVRLSGQGSLGCAGVLRKRAAARPEYRVARFELRYVSAYCFYKAGPIHAKPPLLRSGEYRPSGE